MASTTSNLGLTKPAYTDDADIGDLNGNFDLIDAEAGRVRANFAGAYSTSSAYAVGAYVIYQGNLYKCTTAIGSGGEAWNSAHWDQVSVGTELGTLNSKIGNKAIRCGTIDFECQASDWADWNGWKMLTKSVSVSFSGAFTQTPYVVATAYSSGNENLCSVLGIVNTKDGISTIYLSRPNTTYGSVKIRWIAIGT